MSRQISSRSSARASRSGMDRTVASGSMTPTGADLLAVLHEAATEVRAVLDGLDDWGLAGTRAGQYRSDLAADAVAVATLTSAGLGVMSEESGDHHPSRPVVV